MKRGHKILSMALTAAMSVNAGVGFYAPVSSGTSSDCAKVGNAPKWKKKRRKIVEKSRRINRRKR